MLKIGEIVQTVKGIVETRISLVKQEIQEEFVGILSKLILLVVMGSMLMLTLLFLSFWLAFFLSRHLQSPHFGFLIVALIYLVLALIIYISRDSLGVQDKVNHSLKGFIFKRKKNRIEDEQES